MTGYVIATGGGHLADGTLMELLDGAASPDARAHLASCSECGSRLAALQRAAALLRSSLPAVPMPAIDLPRATPRRPWIIPIPMAAAATLVVLASAAAATPPVREWIRSRLVGAPSPIVTPVSNPPAVSGAVQTAGIVASFIPTDTVLVIRVDRGQSSGAIELGRGTGDRISAQAVDGTSAEELIVLPGQLRIANSVTSTAGYRVTVPASVRSIRIIVAGKETAIVVNDGRLDRRIPLR